jgi:hypothetical protein
MLLAIQTLSNTNGMIGATVSNYKITQKGYRYLHVTKTSWGLGFRFDRYGFEVQILNVFIGLEW